MGGDTQALWSFFYFSISSLVNFHEFAWWDPTAFNGWPAYYYATSVYVSYLSPYSVPALGLAIIGHAFGMSVNTFLILHKTVLSYGLSLAAILLISRELVRHPFARFLPALIFTVSEISFHGFRDAVLYENMPPALFYLFGLIYYNNRRTPAAFILFVFLTGAFLASLNYSFLQSSLYWTSAFTLLLVAFFPDLLKATWVVVTQLWSSKFGRAVARVVACALDLRFHRLCHAPFAKSRRSHPHFSRRAHQLQFVLGRRFRCGRNRGLASMDQFLDVVPDA